MPSINQADLTAVIDNMPSIDQAMPPRSIQTALSQFGRNAGSASNLAYASTSEAMNPEQRQLLHAVGIVRLHEDIQAAIVEHDWTAGDVDSLHRRIDELEHEQHIINNKYLKLITRMIELAGTGNGVYMAAICETIAETEDDEGKMRIEFAADANLPASSDGQTDW
ncbi:hypothetical protein BT67DRAFT_455853 [Trichocladium antarcticum]|uniref:Uncharacterized protein n=1 Tax=Trichocladium antarcticum TaxID=1450529 RepID=A0AAN6UKB5_9PEZI|nr:hypothetical protein BT67DRAFT_455853 [Trichocladium antarcticum]